MPLKLNMPNITARQKASAEEAALRNAKSEVRSANNIAKALQAVDPTNPAAGAEAVKASLKKGSNLAEALQEQGSSEVYAALKNAPPAQVKAFQTAVEGKRAGEVQALLGNLDNAGSGRTLTDVDEGAKQALASASQKYDEVLGDHFEKVIPAELGGKVDAINSKLNLFAERELGFAKSIARRMNESINANLPRSPKVSESTGLQPWRGEGIQTWREMDELKKSVDAEVADMLRRPGGRAPKGLTRFAQEVDNLLHTGLPGYSEVASIHRVGKALQRLSGTPATATAKGEPGTSYSLFSPRTSVERFDREMGGLLEGLPESHAKVVMEALKVNATDFLRGKMDDITIGRLSPDVLRSEALRGKLSRIFGEGDEAMASFMQGAEQLSSLDKLRRPMLKAIESKPGKALAEEVGSSAISALPYYAVQMWGLGSAAAARTLGHVAKRRTLQSRGQATGSATLQHGLGSEIPDVAALLQQKTAARSKIPLPETVRKYMLLNPYVASGGGRE